MKKTIFALLVPVLLIGLSGCVKPVGEGEVKEDFYGNQKSGLANPASVYCEEEGGSLKNVETEAGTAGICVLADGTECDEWEYYRGECPKKEDETATSTDKNNSENTATGTEVIATSTEEQTATSTTVLESGKVIEDSGTIEPMTEAEKKEVENWQTVNRADNGFSIRFHKDWYYTIDYTQAASAGYDLLIGFSPTSDIWETSYPYPVVLVVLDADKVLGDNLEYVKLVTTRNGKKYILATDDTAEYADVMSKMAKTLAFTE